MRALQEFLGFVNYYCKFVPGYSQKATHLFNLLRKDTEWNWIKTCQEAFKDLKKTLQSAPLLIQPDPTKPFFLECNALDFATGAVLSQKGEDNKLHPVAYLSKSMSSAERNYNIYNKELSAIVKAFKEWRHLLEGTETPVQILSDHKNLEWLKTTKELQGRLAQWAGFPADFNLQILYIPGSQNWQADILSQKEQHCPK